MQDELRELLEAAMYREIASQAFYMAGQNNTEDAGAKALMKELAEEECPALQEERCPRPSNCGPRSPWPLRAPRLRSNPRGGPVPLSVDPIPMYQTHQEALIDREAVCGFCGGP